MSINLFLDNIIYSLQRGGGTSVVWSEHIKRLLKDSRFSPTFLEYPDASENFMRKNLIIPDGLVNMESSSLFLLKRYMNLNSSRNTPYVFHSSHYRIDNCRFAKNVTTVHDFVYEYFVHGLRQKIHSFQKWQAIQKSDAIICISESTKRDVLKFVPKVNEEKIVVIPHGVDESYYILDKKEYSHYIPFDTAEYILYVGTRHVPYKNFGLVVEVCSRLKRPLVMVGGEPLSANEVSQLEATIGKERFVLLRGIDNCFLNELYNRACVLLYPSLYEGFGIPIIEAQRSGVPVICANTSSIPEVVGDTDMCMDIPFNCDDVCTRIRELEFSDYRTKEIKKGLNNSLRFNWDNTYKLTTAVYESLMS